ncbi:MAG: type IV pilin protein [Woeseiaceae bacterium]|nr:type IV pilin protein [Woeseiaceae bacterium]
MLPKHESIRVSLPARMRGITLFELMIVVVIIGILASIAYPSYQEQVRKTRRADGTAQLMQTAQALERCYTRSATYVGCATVAFPVTSQEGYYSVTAVGGVTATAYTLAAAPQGDQVSDTNCGTLSLTSTGIQGSTGTLPVDRCW